MKQAGPSFLHLLELDGQPLAEPPPMLLTRQEKLRWLSEQTRRQYIAVPDQVDRLSELVREQETKRMQECESQ